MILVLILVCSTLCSASAAFSASIDWKIGMSPSEQNVIVSIDGDYLTRAEVTFTWAGNHNVYAMTSKEAFDSCNFTGATESGTSSPDKVSLFARDAYTTVYYACKVGSHCANGQKVAISVGCTGDNDTAVAKDMQTAMFGMNKHIQTCAQIVEESKCYSNILEDGYLPNSKYCVCACAPNAPKSAPKPSPMPSPMPNPSPMPSPMPNPSPMPSPTPAASPTSNPSPDPSPTPSPTPNPLPMPSPMPAASPMPDPFPDPSPTPVAAPTPSPLLHPSPTPSSASISTPEPIPAPMPVPTLVPTNSTIETQTQTDKSSRSSAKFLLRAVVGLLCMWPAVFR